MQEFESCPFGIIGLDTAIGLTFDCLVNPRTHLAHADDRALHNRSRRRSEAGAGNSGDRKARRRDRTKSESAFGRTTLISHNRRAAIPRFMRARFKVLRWQRS